MVLTEKPSVAEDLGKAIGVTERKRGYFQGRDRNGNVVCITWCMGHLVELYAEEADGRWELQKLPIIPREFELRPIEMRKQKASLKDGNEKEEDKPNVYVERLKTIGYLFGWADEIIAATDAGREGQLIFGNVYRYLKCNKKVMRLWTSSMTSQALSKAYYDDLKDNSMPEMRNLEKAAWERAVSDWIVGINATRAFSLATDFRDITGKKKIISLGRVQSPTLCMICDRFEEHKNFKSEPFWYIEGTSSKNGVPFKWKSIEIYTDKDKAQYCMDSVQAGQMLRVTDINTERKNEQAPLLHDIASLQKMANSRYGMSMEDTLAIAQRLYMAKLITYPRTGSRYIPEDVFGTIPELLKSVCYHEKYGEAAERLLNAGKLNRNCVNDGKITDHHGFLITGRRPGELSENERRIYELILSRMIEAFSPICIADVTRVELECADVRFLARGRKYVSAGWRGVESNEEGTGVEIQDADNIEIGMASLPELETGEYIPMNTVSLVEDKTKPKPYYTDATLITAMENAGRKSDDKNVVEALRDIGIGTPATRSDIKATLVERGYIVVRNKFLLPTELGLELYHAIRGEEIANVEMTARWEMMFQGMADGEKSSQDIRDFEKGIKNYAELITRGILESDGVKTIRRKMEEMRIKCPGCGGDIRITDKLAFCKGCGYKLGRIKFGKKLSESTLRQLFNDGQTGLLTGLVGKSGKPFDAAFKLADYDKETGWANVELIKNQKRKQTNA